MRYGLVMPAAGSGRRFAADVPKQYQPLAGRSLIEHSLRVFLADSDCARICVVVAPGDTRWAPLQRRLANSRLSAVEGGAERADSVRKGLDALASHLDPNDWVMVHDAARPCITASDIDALKAALVNDAVGGLLATPLSDTLKRQRVADAQTTAGVDTTVDRAGLWRALTPQMFRLELLRRALESAAMAGRTATDESQALEWLGHSPRLVPGSPSNIKVTTAEDLSFAAAVLAARHRG
jgi:2-C-methyl-D-erythritol 4-phosphate cytidylyltransferase